MTRPISILLILSLFLSLSYATPHSHFEGFDDSDDEIVEDQTLPLKTPDLTLTLSNPDPPQQPDPISHPDQPQPQPQPTKSSSFDYWDEDEFEGVPLQEHPQQKHLDDDQIIEPATESKPDNQTVLPPKKRSFVTEIACGSFLVMFVINYFTGKRENENLALSWASKFATKDTIFEKNFSLLGVGEGDDSPLLLKEGQNVFKFYASGRRYCQGLLATMELKSRHDLISRIYNMVVPCKDEVTLEVYMNEEAMDHVVFAVARKKVAKAMQKEEGDLQRFAMVLGQGPSGRKWVAEDLAVVSESKEVAGDLITEAVLDQVFGEKAFEKYGKYFISLHFSDQHPGTHRKMLVFKFALPDANNMAEMTRLVALVPYYIDLIGRYKLSSQARSKTDAARVKAAQEAYKELQNARQEAIQRKKAEKKKMLEEADAKLSAEVIRKKEAKERGRQAKSGRPKIKMSRAH